MLCDLLLTCVFVTTLSPSSRSAIPGLLQRPRPAHRRPPWEQSAHTDPVPEPRGGRGGGLPLPPGPGLLDRHYPEQGRHATRIPVGQIYLLLEAMASIAPRHYLAIYCLVSQCVTFVLARRLKNLAMSSMSMLINSDLNTKQLAVI